VLAACAPDRGEVREWKASDHEQAEGRPAQQAPQQGAPRPGGQDTTSMLVDTTWTRTCAACHGRGGKGDGPQGSMVNAPDLTASKLSDAEMASIIKNGKNRMAPNPDLPDAVITGLVAKIRALSGPSQ
jgi:cytochrome c oxidase cbb3-type subunit 3